MKIELRELSIHDGPDVLEMIREIGPGENGYTNSDYAMDDSEFPAYLERNVNMAAGKNLQPWQVPQTQYWLYVDGRPIGVGRMRHYLNDKLLKDGGHIDYCIRPSERGKGYGNLILHEVLKRANAMRIDRVLIMCDEANTASRRVIEKNGGRLGRAVENGDCFYWVDVSASIVARR